MTDRSDPDLDRLWQEFHDFVNMTSEELRAFLMAAGSGEDASPADPGQWMPGLGREVLNILGKRKVDLTSDDIETMRRVIGVAEDAEAHASANVRDDERRRALMAVGHDPLRPSRTEG
ncbi:DUF3140 domain-containing protein [Planobispora longispora]|uniref:DUF3140 domain-containing protein n=1 Tax=Planobispora longispora TaxID=28887 RepID=A0A8J3RPJ7_9ACTN|nr:DUF3140 domain-containing protein [Planobispora longispora]GIH78385.1 hypothetical protein Plo01_48140 [Planobispora longispora]